MIDFKKSENKISSNLLASLIIDALIDAHIIDKSEMGLAIEITEEEINARKAAGDY